MRGGEGQVRGGLRWVMEGRGRGRKNEGRKKGNGRDRDERRREGKRLV